MNPLLLIATAVAGGLGAGARYVVDVAVMRGIRGRFPWGVFVVNVSGSLALGVLTGLASAIVPEVAWIVGVGFLGGYTTFSTVAVESRLLLEDGRRSQTWANGAGTAVACIAAAALGVALGAGIA